MARQAPVSMGFSRQEYWSGLPLPSPVIKHGVSEVKSLSRVQLCDPMDCSLSGSSVHGIPQGFSRQEYWSGLPFPSPGDLSDPGIELRSPALQVDSLPAEPPGKP